jgi:hypothetical protein
MSSPSSRSTLGPVRDPLPGTAAVQRGSGFAAVLAGGLWAAQGLIWTLGPKVQAAEPPYRITDRPLFALFWLAIVGAVLCSAVALLGLLRQDEGRHRAPRTARASAFAAWASLGTAGVAVVAVVAAALGVAEGVEGVGLGVLAPALNLAGLLLLIALLLAAAARPHDGILAGRAAALPAALAVLTLLTLSAIMASSSTAAIGLILAVVVVAVTGTTWGLLGWILLSRRP